MWMLCAAFLIFLLLQPSCAVALGAAIGAGAVHTTSEDTVGLTTSRDAEEAYAASESSLDRLGAVNSAESDQVRIRISARRVSGFSPDLKTARRVACEIADRLN
jgi:hypothetical protein